MRTVDIFEWTKEIYEATPNSRKYAVVTMRHGPKGLKSLNPAAVWVDAAISVSNAAISYAEYARNKEITKQLLGETKNLKNEIALELKRVRIDNGLLEKQYEQRIEAISRAFKEDKKKSDAVIRGLRGKIDSVRRISEIVNKVREQSDHDFDALQDLILFKDVLVRETLSFVLTSTG